MRHLSSHQVLTSCTSFSNPSASRRRLPVPGEDRRGRGGAEDGGQRPGGLRLAGGAPGQDGAAAVQSQAPEDAGHRVSGHAAVCFHVSLEPLISQDCKIFIVICLV